MRMNLNAMTEWEFGVEKEELRSHGTVFILSVAHIYRSQSHESCGQMCTRIEIRFHQIEGNTQCTHISVGRVKKSISFTSFKVKLGRMKEKPE